MRFLYSSAPHTNSIVQVFNFIKYTTIFGWRSVCFVRCLPSYKISRRAHLLAAVALFMLYLDQNHA
jgi:hypothetical protein